MDAIGFQNNPKPTLQVMLQTIEDLISRDDQREKDGFPRRIRLGRIVKPNKNNQKVVVVPTTTEPKFYHDDSVTSDEQETGGTGDGQEGEVIGEAPAESQQGEGEGQGAGQGGDGEGHDVVADAFDLGRILTQKFQLPNLKVKGKKRSFTKYKYDLTDRNRRTGQLLDKKATLRKIIQTNILLGNLDEDGLIDPEKMVLNPQDEIYRILSAEKDFETQAVVFFLRDYSGSMQGKPTESVTSQHLLIYSWLMYQYNENVETRFILHDQTAKEVKDFHTYHNSSVAGGTNVFPAFELVNKIIEEESLYIDNNIYVFYGTDGDDWDSDGKRALEETEKILVHANRMGITVARNTWTTGTTTVERYFEQSGLLKNKPDLIRIDAFSANDADEARLIEGIKKLVEQKA
ncbi:MAG: DUF444 family protein [Candidatus Kapabacteria bacterium]|nr:DUF444 family protein [Ignavibacteriota bacterium]MCW5886428.1 DUF444 family protein [Candidatus Kapabacteria bacterium]